MNIKDERYDYHITVSAHVIVQKGKSVLIALRPKTWEWAPGRWSLIGGKLYKEESFTQAIKRKTKQELGFEVNPKGLYQIKQLLIGNKNAYMYFFVAQYNNEKISGEMTEYRWVNTSDIKAMKQSEFAEYYYKEMFTDFFTGKTKIFPMSKIDVLDYTKIRNTNNYKKWFRGVVNEDYDPNQIKDYKKWQKLQKK